MTQLTITEQIVREIQADPEFDAKFDRQCVLEERMRSEGIDRHWNQIRKAEEKGRATTIGSVRRLMNYATERLAEGIRDFTEKASRKRGVTHTAAEPLKKLEPESSALIAARVILDGVASGRKMAPTAIRIAQMIEDEIAFRTFKEKDKKAYKWLAEREKKNLQRRPYEMTAKVMRANMDSRGIDYEEWDTRTRTIVGTKLIELMIQTTGLVEQVRRYTGKNRTDLYIVATKEAMDWLNEENSRCEILSPVYLPTIVPPKPWTTPTDGGYWTSRVRRLKMIKTDNKAYLEELEEMDMPEVYDALNAMQHTAWRINDRVLATVSILWRNGSTIGGIPKADDIELPPKPVWLEGLDPEEYPKEQWSEAEMEEFKSWKRKASDIHVANDQLKSLRLQFSKILKVAEDFVSEDRIYFPHQLDFRGRCYAVPMFLNPQGSDLAKGLLHFADGVPINDEEGRAWLAVHGANVYGYDKVSLEDRVRWVEDHEEEILASARDPFNNRFWASTDDAWQFLAFCFEWAALKEHGWGYLSTLPVQMDGSCNGLQNFSAALRDPIGGAAVNLVPQDKPADIYQKVADRVVIKVTEDAEQSDDEEIQEIAQGWLKLGINRKVCKRPVMTLAYGAKEFGFKNQVNEDTVKPAKIKMGDDFPWSDSGWKAADYMGKRIWEAVGEVVVAAREAMDWFQQAARVATAEGLPIRWTTPDGLPVLQSYQKLDTKRVELTFGGARLRLSVAEAQEGPLKLDRARQANGISPNWVHSMDASHMRETVRRCWAEGMRSFSLVHDSYGTHAGNAWALADILREAFIGMYSGHDVLTEFREELSEQLPEDAELPPLPQKGTLDLDLVMESDFFFA